MNFNNDEFDILRKISKEPNANQRDLAKKLGLSLGKINYCIRALKKKGLIKINNFKKNKRKFNYLYMLTPKGVSEKTRITINFMKQKMKEYDELQSELKENKKIKNDKCKSDLGNFNNIRKKNFNIISYVYVHGNDL